MMSYNIHSSHSQSLNGPSQDPHTRDVGPQLHILQLNIDGISRNKSEYLSRILHDSKIKVLLLQETLTGNEEDILNRGNIAGFSLAHAIYHNKYGTVIYNRNDIAN